MVANIHYFVLDFSLNRMAGLISFCVCPPSPLKGGLSPDILELFLTQHLRPPLGGRSRSGRGALHMKQNPFSRTVGLLSQKNTKVNSYGDEAIV